MCFFKDIKKNEIEIYNEFSLQHELGIYLRLSLPDYKVQFERNVSFFCKDIKTIKREIDIVIYTEDKRELYAIELKNPLNGQFPEQMYSFAKDIKFMEELKERGFTKTFALTKVSQKPFYEGIVNEGIYKYFRSEFAVYGDIFKPTGARKNNDFISFAGRHEFEWVDMDSDIKYYIIEI